MVAAPTDAFVVRPHRLRVIVAVFSVGLVVLTAVGWLALPPESRALFTVSQRLTLIGLLAALIVVIVAAAASYVRADADGLRIRNGFRVHTVPWSRVHKILLRRGDAWGLLLLKPADGSKFEVDIDAEKRQLMGIQRGDGEIATGGVEELRRRMRASRG